MTPTVHSFFSTGEAYDASQCRDDIHDGDVLNVPGEGVVGILVRAWPVAVTSDYGAFHALAPDSTWESLEDGRYLPSVEAARRYVERAA